MRYYIHYAWQKVRITKIKRHTVWGFANSLLTKLRTVDRLSVATMVRWSAMALLAHFSGDVILEIANENQWNITNGTLGQFKLNSSNSATGRRSIGTMATLEPSCLPWQHRDRNNGNNWNHGNNCCHGRTVAIDGFLYAPNHPTPEFL